MQKLIVTTLFFLTSFNALMANNLVQENERNQSGSAIQKAEEYLNKLQSYYDAADYEAHKTYSDSLFVVATKHRLTKMQVLALTNQAVYFKNRGERLKAIELYHQALNQCELIPDDYRTRIVLLVNMGNIYSKIGSYQKSINYYNRVIADLDTYENSDRIRAATFIGLANCYIELGDLDKTISFSNKAKLLGEQINNEEVMVSAANNMARAYNISKQYDKALAINNTINSLKFLNNPTQQKARLLLNTAIANYNLDKLKQAKNDFKTSAKLSNEKEFFEIEMYAHEYLAKIYELEGDYKKSVQEQKAYTAIRELYLQDKSAASNADLNNEINSKSEAIEAKNEALQDAEKDKNMLLYVGGTALIVVSVFLLIYIKRKRVLDAEKEKLQSQYIKLKEDMSLQKNEKPALSKHESENVNVEKKPYKNSSLTNVRRNEIKEKVLRFMKEEKPYLNAEMTQADLAEGLEISSHHLSEVLYFNMEQNFYSFINSYRILEAQRLMKAPEYSDSKIIAIAFDSGFKSKTSFNRVFKNYTNMTPSEFRDKNG